MQLASAPATYAFIVVTVLVSLYAMFGDSRFVDEFACRPKAITRTKGHHRLATHAFIHAGPLHLLLNMASLLSFGPVVETILGTTGFIVLYLGSAIAGGLMILQNNRGDPNHSAIGASGAVSGVLLSFCLFLPFESVYLLGLPFGMPAVLFAALYIGLSMHLMRTPDRVISHEGHLGGALGGLVLTLVMKPEALTNFFA